MPFTIDQICETCCSSITEKTFYTIAGQLLCGIASQEAVAGCVCYDADPPNLDIHSAIRLLDRNRDGSFSGTMRYIDALTGAEIDPANIVDCIGVDCTYFTGV